MAPRPEVESHDLQPRDQPHDQPHDVETRGGQAEDGAIAVGRPAPDFTLVDQYGVDVSLSSVRGGRNAVIVFYPAAFSGICRGELRSIRDGLEDFQTDDIQVFAVSCDSMYTLRAWADAEGHFFPLLSDFWPHGEVARRYGVFDDEEGYALRGTFLVDREGLLVWSEVLGIGQGRDFTAYRVALAGLRESQAISGS